MAINHQHLALRMLIGVFEDTEEIRPHFLPCSPSSIGETLVACLGSSRLDDPDQAIEPRMALGGNESQWPFSYTYQSPCDEQDFDCTRTGTTKSPALTDGSSHLFESLPPTIEYSDLCQRFMPILDRYNSEFCTIPLTFDLPTNPFRYRKDLDPEPIFLVHAVMALAGHHVKNCTTLSHRHAALQFLRQSLDMEPDAESMYAMLDTIVILFSLDETQSTLGSWNTHLVGALSLIETCGGVKRFTTSSRVEVQIAIIIWWDAIISLLSREDCVFPYAYFEAILSNQYKREWEYFGLCGCPTSLVRIVMQVARLSAQKQKSSSKSSLEFNQSLIAELGQSLEAWYHVPTANVYHLQDEDYMHWDQDIMHCSEAWRHALLLYIFRVFHWEPGSDVPMSILHHARLVVDHIVLCREKPMISRQALLPLFFAGCELRDKSTQKQILKFCSHWDERTGYHMFKSTIPLLEEVWAEQVAKGYENVWWGQIVAKHHTSEAHPIKMRLCFG